MRYPRVATVAALVLLGSAGSNGQSQNSSVADEITRLLNVHRADYLKGDTNAWTAMYAEDAIFVGVAGGQRNLEGREAIREYFAKVMTDFPTRTADPSNIRLRVYNEQATPTVILTLEDHGSRTDASGRQLVSNFRETLVWTKVQGKWYIVNHHASPLPAPKPSPPEPAEP
jgi:uncharacterized protein (TIGR02246 family)